MNRLILALILTGIAPLTAFSQPLARLMEEPGTWVFLGDSNTYAGGYVAAIDAALQANMGEQAPRVLNLGVSSETASGRSEPDHPFPRPCVHARIDKVLTMIRPRVVFACYGMNDGIYAQPAPELMSDYQAGITRLVHKVKASGAILVLCTPPPFEAAAIRAAGKSFGPTAEGNYAWFAPAENYDSVVKEMSAWIMENKVGAPYTLDLRSPLQEFAKTQDQPLTGDGVHFQEPAHKAVADHILGALGVAPTVSVREIPAEQLEIARRRMSLLRDSLLSVTGKNRPSLPAGLPPAIAWQKARELSSK